MKNRPPTTPSTHPPRLNALKHGIMTREVLVHTSDFCEDEAELDQIAAKLRADLAPEGALEDLLVDQLIAFTWRWRRVLRFEAASIAYRAGHAAEDLSDRRALATQGNSYFTDPDGPGGDRSADIADLDADLAALRTPDPLSSRPDLWRRAFDVAERDCGLMVPDVVNRDVGEPQGSRFTPDEIELVLATACERGACARETIWKAVRAAVAADRDRLAAIQQRRGERQAARVSRNALSNDDDLAKVGRYEAHLSRQFYRSLHELAQIQATRQSSRPLPDTPAHLHRQPVESTKLVEGHPAPSLILSSSKDTRPSARPQGAAGEPRPVPGPKSAARTSSSLIPPRRERRLRARHRSAGYPSDPRGTATGHLRGDPFARPDQPEPFAVSYRPYPWLRRPVAGAPVS